MVPKSHMADSLTCVILLLDLVWVSLTEAIPLPPPSFFSTGILETELFIFLSHCFYFF
jgi:hypothetical protein